MPEPLHCTSRKPQEVGCDTATLTLMDTYKISQATSKMGPPSAQLPAGLPVELPKSHGHSQSSLFCVHGLGNCTKAEAQPGAFALVLWLGCPCFMQLQGRSGQRHR